MIATAIPFLGYDDLLRLGRDAAQPQPAAARCAICAGIAGGGWDSLGASVDRAGLVRVGSLRDPAIEEPTVEEHHPRGTHAWSADAPIAPAFFPYNRCELWRCRACGRLLLRYTEYGGYYEDERVRAFDPALLDDAPSGAGAA